MKTNLLSNTFLCDRDNKCKYLSYFQRSSGAIRQQIKMQSLLSDKLERVSGGQVAPSSASASSINYNNHNNHSNDTNSPDSSGGSSNITALHTKMAAHRKYAALGKSRPNDSRGSTGEETIKNFYCLFICLLLMEINLFQFL